MQEKRRLRLTVTAAEDGLTLEKVLERRFGISRRLLNRYKYREDGLLINGIRRRAVDRVSSGDVLTMNISDPGTSRSCWEAPEGDKAVDILYEDADLLIADKPSGMVCHPSFGHFRDSLANILASRLGLTGTRQEIHIVGRLDRDTCGCVLVARNALAAELLFRQQREGICKKTYLALAENPWGEDEAYPPESGEIRLPIRPVDGVLMLRETGEGGQVCCTHYRREARLGDRTLLTCQLEQGRTHQIRVHLSSIGHPLAGDRLYGKGGASEEFARTGERERVAELNREGREEELGLCAWKLRLCQPFTGEAIQVEAKRPAWSRTL